MRMVSALLGLLLFGASPALAQFDTATVVGTVRDTSGAVIAGAKVTLTSAGTGISAVKTSTADGNYEFPAVRPGIYLVTAEKTGFALALADNHPGAGGRPAPRRPADAGRADHREGRGHGHLAADRNRLQPARAGDHRRPDARAAAEQPRVFDAGAPDDRRQARRARRSRPATRRAKGRSTSTVSAARSTTSSSTASTTTPTAPATRGSPTR